MVRCRVMLLDGKDFTCDIDKQAKGQALFDKVCQHINLLEKDYFACSFRDTRNVRFWLRNDKKINRQIGNSKWLFSFEVKFYPPEPSVMKEELTRYQLFLQLRRDIVSAKLPCSFMSHAVLGSYVVQSQCGDYEPTEHGAGIGYICHMTLAPEQCDELLTKVAELHKTHRGLLPAEAEFYFLQNAKKLALYGVDLHLAKDNTGAEVEIGICATGLLLYKNHLRISRFTWPKILSFSYKWNVFSVKIRPAENESSPTNWEYKLPNDKMAKRLWRIAVEHHTFFRLREPGMPSHGLMAHFTPKYHYSGRTLYQTQLACSASASGTLDRSTTSSLLSSRRHAGGSKSLESVLAGYSTERSELYASNSKRTATLDLKTQKPKMTAGTPTNETRTYLTSDAGRHSMDNLAYGNDYTRHPHSSSTVNCGAAASPYSTSMGSYSARSDGKLLPYQDDILPEHGYGRQSGGSETWNPYVGGTYMQSKPRTYCAPDGSVITEYSTARNGPLENQFDSSCYDSGIDYDKALTEAILAVTFVNTDLSVEKIEITHSSTVSH